MNAQDVYLITKRPPGRWRVWLACFLMALDFFILPIWVVWLGSMLSGDHGGMELNGHLVPEGFSLALGVMAILSVLGVAAIATWTDALGFRIVFAVAIAWVIFYGVSWAVGAYEAGPIVGRVVILGLLLWGRGPFLPGPVSGRAPAGSAP
jgi:hypothetical protein